VDQATEFKSYFERIADALLANGNEGMTTRQIAKAVGISRSALSQVVWRTHKEWFVSHPVPGCSRKKRWALTEEGKSKMNTKQPGQKADLFRREWAPLELLEASALLTSTTAKITMDEKGITLTVWFPWLKTPHKKESTDGKAEDPA